LKVFVTRTKKKQDVPLTSSAAELDGGQRVRFGTHSRKINREEEMGHTEPSVQAALPTLLKTGRDERRTSIHCRRPTGFQPEGGATEKPLSSKKLGGETRNPS